MVSATYVQVNLWGLRSLGYSSDYKDLLVVQPNALPIGLQLTHHPVSLTHGQTALS
jgi:hypothetical protein